MYDAASNLTKATDRNGRIVEHVYDALHRPTQEVWKDASSNTVNTITSTYDGASQLTSVADGFSEYAYTYDGLGRVTEVANAGTPNQPNVVLTSTYDANWNRTQLAASVGGTADFVNAYTYDALNRMTRIEQSDGAPAAGNPISAKRVDLSYNAAGQFETIARYADLGGTDLVATTSHTYDGIGRLTDLTHSKGANTLADYAWAFDAANRVTSMTGPDGTSTYTYDATDQLTGADHSYQTDESYTYNHTGGRTDSDNDYVAGNRLVDDGTYTYTFDDEGNRTRKTTNATGDYIEYKWDHRNRLTAVEYRTSAGVLTKAVAYEYDVFSRLLRKQVDETGDGVFDRAEKFVYDGLDIVLVLDDAGSLESRFLHGPAVDQFFAEDDALGEVLWGLTDNLGTVRDVVEYDAVTDTTSVANHLKYDSFGNVTSESNASASPLLKFTGRHFDEDVDLQWNLHRWYDAAGGLWLSLDPIGFAGGDANLYRYVGNDPLNFKDPFGLEVAGKGHMYPLYLGGSPDQVVFELSRSQHTAMHEYFREQGLGRQGNKYDAARERWKQLSPEQRRAIVKEGMRRANIPESMISNKIGDVMKDSQPGVNRSGQRKTPRKSDIVAPKQIEEAKRRGSIPPQTPKTPKKMKQAGESAANRLGKKAKGILPGPLGLLFFADNAEAKGVDRAALDEVLDSIPLLEWLKAYDEVTSGKDWVPAPGEESAFESGPNEVNTTGPGVDIPDPICSNAFDPPLDPPLNPPLAPRPDTPIFRPSPVFVEPRPAVVAYPGLH